MSKKSADTDKVIGKVIRRSQAIERLLRSHYNAPAGSLHKAIKHLAGTLPVVLAHAIRVIADARNVAAHSDSFKNPPADFDRLCDEIEVLIRFFAAKQTSQVDAVPIHSATRTSPNAAANPANRGKPWTPAEDKMLVDAFDARTSIPQLAKAHERGVGGIQARLAKLGKLGTDQFTTFRSASQ